MTMDVSRLGIVVESTGINEARKALDGGNGKGGLVGAADKAERSVGKLSDTVTKLMAINASGFSSAWNQSMIQLVSTLGAMNKSVRDAITGLNAMAPALDRAAQATQKAASANERKAYSGGVVVNTLKAMTTAALAYEAVRFGASIVKQADAWQMMSARLTNATGSLQNAQVAQQQMFDLSQRLRVPLEDSVKLYTRLAPAVQRMGKDSGYAKDMVEGIATALQLGGANGAEASSVMLQLSQSFSSGVLNGAEFNAVAENGSVLMRALEKYTGKASWELKKMGSEGKLSMQTVGEAIQKFLPEWREQFDRLPLTFEGAMQRLTNAWTKAVGDMGQDTGFNIELSKSLRVIEEMIPAIARGLGDAFISVMGWVKKNREGIVEVWDSVKGVAQAVWLSVTRFVELNARVLDTGSSAQTMAMAFKVAALFVTGLADGLSVVYAALLGIGGVIAGFYTAVQALVTGPLFLLLKGLQKFSEFMDWVSGGDAASKKLAEGFGTAADSMAAWQTKTSDFMFDLFKKSGDIIGAMSEGSSATKEFLNGIEAGATKASAALAKTQGDIRKFDAMAGMDEEAWNASKNPKKRTDEKALKAQKAEEDKYLKAMEDLNAKYEEQVQLRERLVKLGSEADKLSPATKTVIALQEHLNSLIDKGASETALVNAMTLLARAREVETLDLQNRKTQEALKLSQALVDQQSQTTHGLEEEALKLEQQVATYGMAKGAVEALALAEAKRRYAELDATSDGQRTPEMEARLALLGREIVARERIAEATAKLGALQVADEFDKLFDPKKAEKFGDVLSEGFGNVGKALGKLMNSFDKYEARQSKIKEGWKKVNIETDPTKRAKMTERLIDEETQSRLASYADMAGAAKGFFEEGSRGYKAMEAAEKAFRLFQMAMNMKSFLQEIGLLEASTAATVTANTTKAASDVASATVSASASMMEGTAAAAAGVANQAKGDPYTAWTRMAAMAAVMAALGFAVSGGGGSGVDVAKQRQASQGTGTVLGDASAKSESISKSIERLSENSDIALRYSSGMLNSLQNIEYSLTGATSGVIRTPGATGAGFESSSGLTSIGKVLSAATSVFSSIPVLGDVLGSITSALFGTSTKLKDSGLAGVSQSVKDILENGFNVRSYQDVNKKKSFFGVTYSNKTSTKYGTVDPSVSNEFGNVIQGMVESLTAAAEVLGFSGEEIKKKLEAANIDIGKISLKGLTGEEIQKQLEAVFSAIGDKLTAVAIPSIQKFQQAGEGLLETAVRVAAGVESATYELEKLGLTAVDVGSIINTSGDVGAEIVRQSILLKEAGTGVGEIISTLSGEATDIASTYTDLLSARSSLKALGIASDVTRDLIRAAGGLEALQSSLESYTSNFFSEDEKNAMKVSDLSQEFKKLNLAMPTSKEAFRALVATLSGAGAEGQALAVKLIGLSDAFAEVADAYTEKVADARSALTDAYERESSALEDTKARFEEFSSGLKEFKDSLMTGDLSTLNVADKYGVEKAKFEETLAKALSGDETAIGSFSAVAEAFLQASREMNASGEQYTSDFQAVLNATDALTQYTDGRVSTAQQQLDALNKQVEGLITLNESVLSVADAIIALENLLSGGFAVSGSGTMSTIMPVVNGSHKTGLDYVPFDGYVAELHKGEAVLTAQENKAYQSSSGSQAGASDVAEEIRALRAEVQALRQGQVEQTGALVAATYDSNAQNAEAIVSSQREASYNTYNERTKVKIV